MLPGGANPPCFRSGWSFGPPQGEPVEEASSAQGGEDAQRQSHEQAGRTQLHRGADPLGDEFDRRPPTQEGVSEIQLHRVRQ